MTDFTHFIAASVIVAVAGFVYYDYRYRRHWTGYMFGYPLEGFDGQIFFTFDDGPSAYGKVLETDIDTDPIADPKIREAVYGVMPEYDFSKSATDNLLDLLKRHNVKAIFFLCGRSIEGNPHAPGLIRRMVAEGHVVGNHSFSHRHATKEPYSKVIEDFVENHRLVSSMIGVSMNIFRPPYGDWEPHLTRQFLTHPGLRGYSFPLFWSSMFREWALKSHSELAHLGERLTGFCRSCMEDGRGRIVLLHDVYIPAVILTSLIIREAERCGYKIGDSHLLAQSAARATRVFRLSPFLYYLQNLKSRFSLKMSGQSVQHTSYRMDQ